MPQGQFMGTGDRAKARQLVDSLEPREMDVLRGIATGMSHASIARGLRTSSETIALDRARLMRKLNARVTADAVRIAIYAGLAD